MKFNLKNTIAALGLAAATYIGSPKAYADQQDAGTADAAADAGCTDCQTPESSDEPIGTQQQTIVYRSRRPYPVRRGDIVLELQGSEDNAAALRRRFTRLSDIQIRNIEAEALRYEIRNNQEPCDQYLLIPSYVFNRPRADQPQRYGLTPEDRQRLNEMNERLRGLDERVGELGDDLGRMREEEAQDHTEIINRITDNTRDVIRVETTRTIRDSELRDRRQREAARLRDLTRPRHNFLSLGYGWSVEDINEKPYSAGQTLFSEFYGSRQLNRLLSAFVQADGRLDFQREFDAERRLRSVNLNANAGLGLKINDWLRAETYLHANNLSAVIFDNAGDMSVDQYSLGPGFGLRVNTPHLDANLGISFNFGENDITMYDSTGLTNVVLDARVSYQPNITKVPAEFNLRYRLENTVMDDVMATDRSSVDHNIAAEALYRPNILPGLAAGVHVDATFRNAPANTSDSKTVGGVLRYDF